MVNLLRYGSNITNRPIMPSENCKHRLLNFWLPTKKQLLKKKAQQTGA